jgi:hypothetical protein
LEKMLLDTSLWASTRCYLTWKPKDTKQGALLFRLSPQTPTTAEIDAGLLHTPTAKANQLAPSMNSGWNEPLWATPNAMDHLPQRSEESLKKMAEGHRKGRALPSNLREQVDPETVRKWREAQEPNLWATPTKAIAKGSTAGNPNRPNKGGGRDLRQDVKMYPTPTANDFKGSGRNETMRDRLDYAVEKPDGKRVSGSLNPQWVEWLMGYPVGYTDLDS